MSTRTIMVGLFALVAGAAAAVGARQMAQQWEGQKAVPTTNVVTVAMAVPRGEKLRKEQLKLEKWPDDRAPTEALRNIDDAVGRVALAPLFQSQPVNDNMLASRDTPAGLASLIPDGMRAFTIHTPTIASGVAGFVLPGNKVDVLLTVSDTSSLSEQVRGGVTLTLLQRLEILAVDQNLDAPTESRRDAKTLKSVTLLVTPEQAGKLSLAQNKGVLELSLRNPSDRVPAVSTPITVADLQFLGELPQEDANEETDEERVARMVAARMAEREAELAAQRAEEQAALAKREEANQKKMRLALEEQLRREIASARADFAKAKPVVKATPTAVPPVLKIRTLRGTHGGVVLVTPASNASDTSVARRSGR